MVRFLILVVFLIGPVRLYAEGYASTNFTFSGNAHYESATDEYILTNDTYGQRGDLFTQSICSKSHIISFDAFVGALSAPQGGGSGIFMSELKGSDSSLLQNFGLNVQDRFYSSTWFNSITLRKFNDVSSVDTQVKVPFSLTGNGWVHVTWVKDRENVTVSVASSLGIISSSQKRTFLPGVSVKYQLIGWTGAARNKHAIKNFQISISEPDTCAGMELLDLSATRSLVEAVCGSSACPADTAMVVCASNLLSEKQAKGVINEEIANIILNESAAKDAYCDAYKECDGKIAATYTSAFNLGALSIDTDAIRKTSFIQGVASVNIEAIKTIAFNEGVAAGIASVDLETIKALAYRDGSADVDTNYYKNLGYKAGLAACNSGTSDKKVTICHKPRTENKTLVVSIDSLSAHKSHGDTVGACPSNVASKGRSGKNKN